MHILHVGALKDVLCGPTAGAWEAVARIVVAVIARTTARILRSGGIAEERHCPGHRRVFAVHLPEGTFTDGGDCVRYGDGRERRSLKCFLSDLLHVRGEHVAIPGTF